MNAYMTIKVSASTAYEIVLGSGNVDAIAEEIAKVLGSCRLAILTDDKVDALHGAVVERLLTEGGFDTKKYVIPNGEESKNADNLLGFINFMAEQHFTRRDAVVALGGGVVGDMAGFAAAVYMRGIKFVQIPTTLLAAVDSSVGGKTAIDIAAGKNLMGAFHQPALVVCDTDLLSTLAPEVLRDGFAEVIKYGVIADRTLFESLAQGAPHDLRPTIARCVEIKRDIVEADEFENGPRKLLNFGHTIGHAIELLSGYKTSHGNAVAKGMVIAAHIGARMGLKDCTKDIEKILDRYGFDLSCPYPADALYAAALGDKKRSGNEITLIVPEDIGRCTMRRMPCGELLGLLKEIEL